MGTKKESRLDRAIRQRLGVCPHCGEDAWCRWCSCCEECCDCDNAATFDADELGLDPETADEEV